MNNPSSKTVGTSNALVPYQSKVPSVIPSLGNLDAYIQAANRFPILSYEEEQKLVERLHKNNDMRRDPGNGPLRRERENEYECHGSDAGPQKRAEVPAPQGRG